MPAFNQRNKSDPLFNIDDKSPGERPTALKNFQQNCASHCVPVICRHLAVPSIMLTFGTQWLLSLFPCCCLPLLSILNLSVYHVGTFPDSTVSTGPSSVIARSNVTMYIARLDERAASTIAAVERIRRYFSGFR